jgi:arylsulfate sulfotransferase
MNRFSLHKFAMGVLKLVRIRASLLLLSCLFGLVSILSGCASGNSSSGNAYSPATISPSSATITLGQKLQFAATASTVVSLQNQVWSVNGVAGGSAATGTITATGLYTAPTSPTSKSVQVTEGNSVRNIVSAPAQVSFFSPDKFDSGTVTSTSNPQVALYNFNAPQGASVQIQFGTSTNYGLTTWTQSAPMFGGTVGILVAGMRASTTYHMQAMIQLPGGQQALGTDQTFTTGALQASAIPDIAVQQPGSAVAPGVELLDLYEVPKNQLSALATDIAGNVIWYYAMEPYQVAFPIKLLPNGHMLVVVFPCTCAPAGTVLKDEIREVDLAGNVIYKLSIGDIVNGLIAYNSSFTALGNLHHDIQKLPNGHYMILANYTRTFTDQPGFSQVIGDVLVEWDPQKQTPVWTWSAFDHIPLTHDPVSNNDWSHANAIIYSPDDGNLILSMRNQNWVVKINYQNGSGDGKILWHLGPGGDFTLPSGQAPLEWNYGQHYPTIQSPNSDGIFRLMFFNNGNDRLLDANNDVCGTTGFAPCYSSVPLFELNEYTKTAQVVSEHKFLPGYSICCGNAETLDNGNLEYDVAFDVNTPNVSYIQEVTPEPSSQLVWQMNVTGQLMYRGFRLPSLYPGVVWTQAAIATASANATPQPARKPATEQATPFRSIP